ncbi:MULTISPECIES: DUF1217 domain-containing protein [Rhizobium]|uniref:Uncharacterized protein n=1 Tax=Rhizobium paranaense TaxID=1650438 RepID=A0A7W8XLL1_9HYPH|nr:MULTISPECIES: DUF1217 domain-containing protein [Rhizobium]MBB5571663.1 hypothetical protein [Rhizobium paranaense]PST64241.1 flagellar biosynthesis protein FlgF [Rhizobium sp. SEMIA4064]
MISTYLGYSIATRSMATTLKQVATQPENKREIDYYNANIGKVTSVDDFMNDYQLYSYAMEAYGLSDMTYAKAFMKQVLTSDLSDSSSFANKLTDSRYKEFAAAFNFGTSSSSSAQSSEQEDDLVGLYKQSFTTEETNAETETSYYSQHISDVKTVDDLLGNTRLRNYVLQAYGIDPTNVSNTFLKQMLTSDLSDSSSFVNQNGSAADKAIVAEFNFNADGSVKTTTADADTTYYQSQISSITSVDELTSNPKLFDYVKTAFDIPSYITAAQFNASAEDASVAKSNGLTSVLAQFNFQSDGTVASGEQAQTATQLSTTTSAYATNYPGGPQTLGQTADVMSAYNSTVPSFTTDVGATDNDLYYKDHIGSITSIDELTSDTRLFDYVKTAYGIDASTPAVVFKNAFSDSTTASIFGLSNVVAAFNFQSDGTLASGDVAQSQAEITAASTAYMKNYATSQSSLTTDAVSNYKTRIASVKTIDDFFKTNATADSNTSNDDLPEIYQMALRAYGISSDEMSKTQMKKILESDPYDSKSYVSSLKDTRFTNLAKAFNFDSKGKLKPPVQSLSQTQINSYISKYSSSVTAGLTGAQETKAASDAKDAATYFATNIVKVTSVTDLLADSKLTNFILTANGIDPKSVTTATLKKAFASDPSNSKSFINTDDGSQFKSIVEAFNFDTAGNLTDSKLGTTQNQGAIDQTNDLFLHQTLEDQQGESNPGVRLALYFQRKAPDINSIYDIMGDTALYQVVTTTFSLPSSISSMDVDQQAKVLGKVIDVSDLKDPDKVTKLLQRFSAMYDMQNNTTSSTSPALSILTGSSTVGISADTLLSIAQLSNK